MKNIKKFTYGGMIIFSYLGWYLPNLIDWKVSFFTKFGLSIIFAIIGTIVGYQVYKFLERNFG